jgi:hypothetical protein
MSRIPKLGGGLTLSQVAGIEACAKRKRKSGLLSPDFARRRKRSGALNPDYESRVIE